MNTDDDEQFEYGSDDESEDNWDGYSSDGMEFNKPAEDTEIEPEEKALLEKLRKNEVTHVCRCSLILLKNYKFIFKR